MAYAWKSPRVARYKVSREHRLVTESTMRLKTSPYLLLLSLTLSACGGGGGGSQPLSPSLRNDLPASAYDDETIIITLTASNLGAGPLTYEASSSSLSIEPADTSNSFAIYGDASVVGTHAVRFSVTDAAGTTVTASETIRIDTVPTGLYFVSDIGIGGIVVDGLDVEASVTRNGTMALTIYNDGVYDEKCFGAGNVNETSLAFEVWCALTDDGAFVTDKGYRIAGDLNLGSTLVSGTWSIYEPSGELIGTAEASGERFSAYELTGLTAPSSMAGVFLGATLANEGQIIVVDTSGNLETRDAGINNCQLTGKATSYQIADAPRDDYEDRAVFGLESISQTGCRVSGTDFQTGNRDLAAGVGLSYALPGVLFGADASDEVLFLKFSDSTNSFSDTPVDHYFYRVCSATNQPTNFALFTGLDAQCTL